MNDLAVAMVLDKSGSMMGLTGAVMDGFNEYIDGLAEQEGETIFSLTLFDTTFTQPYIGVSLDKVDALTSDLYVAGGNTALYDAIAFTIKDLDARLKKAGREDTKVLVVTLTDGCENSSTDHSAASLAVLVRGYEERGWKFVYLGLGQTRGYTQGLQGIGYVGDHGYFPAASKAGVSHAFASLSASSSQLRATNDMDVMDMPNVSAAPPKVTAIPGTSVNASSTPKLTETGLSDWLGGSR